MLQNKPTKSIGLIYSLRPSIFFLPLASLFFPLLLLGNSCNINHFLLNLLHVIYYHPPPAPQFTTKLCFMFKQTDVVHDPRLHFRDVAYLLE